MNVGVNVAKIAVKIPPHSLINLFPNRNAGTHAKAVIIAGAKIPALIKVVEENTFINL